jgi:hypothetical protein
MAARSRSKSKGGGETLPAVSSQAAGRVKPAVPAHPDPDASPGSLKDAANLPSTPEVWQTIKHEQVEHRPAVPYHPEPGQEA